MYLWISGSLKQDVLPAAAKASMNGEATDLSLSGKTFILFKEPGHLCRFYI